MKKTVESLLDSFDRLPDDDKREAAAEILKRSAAMDLPPLEDEALIDAAEKIFLELESTSFETCSIRCAIAQPFIG